MNTTDNAFLGTGIDSLFGDANANPNEYEFMVNLDDVEIEAQVREEFEDEGNDLASLGKSLAKRQLQAIVIRPNRPGRDKPFLLVAGERRIRAARLEGLPQLRARVVEMDDQEAEDMQLAENIHRKNLTQIEEAKKIQRDLDQLGDTDAVLEKHHKSRAWLSKMLALLTLPEQAKRLVTENVSADVEVINTVKTIEKVDPEAAKELVDDLKATRGKQNAREKVQAVKDKVKPSKKKEGKAEKTPSKRDAELAEQRGVVATPKNRGYEEPGQVDVFAGAKPAGDDKGGEAGTYGLNPFSDDSESTTQDTQERRPPAFSPAEVLNQTYINIFEFGSSPKTLLNLMSEEDKEAVDGWLHSFYDAGVKAEDVGRAVIQGFRNGQFAPDGDGAFALVAFLHGSDSEAKFDLLNIFGSVKS